MLATHQGFLDAILKEPADDGLRLIYADWLEEQANTLHHACWYDKGAGAGSYRCSDCEQEQSMRARAEFIRVQCALASCKQCGGTARNPGVLPCRCATLHRRERELLIAWPAHPRWLGKPDPFPDHPHRDIPAGRTAIRCFGGGVKEIICDFHRGFVSAITCSTEDWIGRVCERCGGTGRYGVRHGNRLCITCHGTGRTGAHGPSLVRACPLTKVTPSDWRLYELAQGGWAWQPDQRQPWNPIRSLAVIYTDQDSARCTVSDELIAWARSKPVTPSQDASADRASPPGS